jgi:hypothetical protein
VTRPKLEAAATVAARPSDILSEGWRRVPGPAMIQIQVIA